MDILVLIGASAFGGLIIGMVFYHLAYIVNQRPTTTSLEKNPKENIAEALKSTQQSEQLLREEVQLLQNKLQQAFADPVTKLSGWQLFEDRLNRSIRESERFQLPLAILFVDIDDFKVINDGLSYEIGNELLKEVSQRLQTCIRQVDVLTRFSKDTFVILLTQLVKPETAAVVAQRILQTLLDPFQIKGHELNITACIGIAIYPTDGKDAAALLRSADHALTLAKEKGKHIYQFYQERLHAQSQRDLVLYNSLSRDSIFNEFILYFSPIINMESHKIICLEVLLNWRHNELGLITANELFLYAEKQRKLNLISEWLLREVCKKFLSWQEQGFKTLSVGLPITIKQLENSHFIYRLSQILQEMNFKPEWLVLQLKEKPKELTYAAVEKAFNMLKYLGVKVMIDDFGTGLFPLAHIKDFQFNYLRLDESVTVDIEQNSNTVFLVQALIQLTQNLKAQLIVQGVKSEKQRELFKSLGCCMLQGPLLTQPLTEKEVEQLLVTYAG